MYKKAPKTIQSRSELFNFCTCYRGIQNGFIAGFILRLPLRRERRR